MPDIMTGPGFTAFVDALCQQQRRRSKLAQVADDLRRCEPRCGNCVRWMCFGSCPREARNSAGRRVGPSCKGVACAHFEIETHVAERKASLLAEAGALKAGRS